MSAGTKLVVSKKLNFSVVPNELFSLPISALARLVLAWALGRPDGWEFYVSHMCKVLGMSDKTWTRARKELTKAGFFIQTKGRGKDGKIVWWNEFTDQPFVDGLFGISAIPPKSTDGESMDGKGGDKEVRGVSYIDVDENEEREKILARSQENIPPSPKPQNPVRQTSQLTTSPSVVEHESGMLIQKEGDRALADQLVEKYGLEKVKEVASVLRLETGAAWPNATAKELSKIAKEGQQRSATSTVELAQTEAKAKQAANEALERFQTMDEAERAEVEARFVVYLKATNPSLHKMHQKSGMKGLGETFGEWLVARSAPN